MHKITLATSNVISVDVPNGESFEIEVTQDTIHVTGSDGQVFYDEYREGTNWHRNHPRKLPNETPIKHVITFTSPDQGAGVVSFEAKGKTFWDAAAALLLRYVNQFDDEPFAPVFKALEELAGGEAEYTHFDFSTPEENFRLNHTKL